MSNLALLTLLPAGILLVLHVGLLWKPDMMRDGFRRFPRDRWSGRVLSAVAIVWAAWILQDMPLGRFAAVRPAIFPLAILLGGLVWYYMDALLAPRALGAILLLYPAPLLAAARLHPSDWRIVMSLVGYVMVIKGMALLLSPYLFRKVTVRMFRRDVFCRMIGGIGTLVAIFLFYLAFFVY